MLECYVFASFHLLCQVSCFLPGFARVVTYRTVSWCSVVSHSSILLHPTRLFCMRRASPPEPPGKLRLLPSLQQAGGIWGPPGPCSPHYVRSGDSPRSPVGDWEAEQVPLIPSYSPSGRWLLWRFTSFTSIASLCVRSSEQFSFFELFAVAHYIGGLCPRMELRSSWPASRQSR